LVPWARKVEAEADGRIKIDVIPSMQLGGSPAQLYDQVRTGVADIAPVMPGHSPGRFPIIETFELPFVGASRATTNSRALQAFAGAALKREFADVRPLFFWTHDRGVLHARRQIARREDLNGLKIRPATRLAGEALRALGARPLPVPVPQVPRALAQKLLDACLLPWEGAPAAKIPELVKFHTDIPGSPTLSATTFVLVMNKANYDALPVELRSVIDANSDEGAAAAAGKLWDDQALRIEETVRNGGNTILTLSSEETGRWRQATGPVIADWLKAMQDRGLPGGGLLDTARELISRFDVV
jgi:TRAP-type C4-dicarboxylate transport system substrate-binding protein